MQEYVFNYRQYKKNISKKVNLNPILFVSIIVLLGLAVYLQPDKISYKYFYFVSAGEFLSYSEAQKVSNEIQTLHGAGYIHYDGKYHVLISYYPKKDDAEKVCENIKSSFPSSKIYELETSKFYENKKLNSMQNEFIKNTLTSNIKLINELYVINIENEKNSINPSEYSLALKKLENNFKYSDFDNCFDSKSKYYESKNHLIDIAHSLETLVEINSKQQEKYKINYEIIKIVFSHHSFVSYF